MTLSLTERTLAELALAIPGATRVFHGHHLDFCCGGRRRLDEAAITRGLDPDAVAAELQALAQAPAAAHDWRGTGNAALIAHLLERYHEVHRQQLPELIRLAHRVERVHGGNADCPRGLAGALEAMLQELESHMQKEEQVLFPLLARHDPGTGGPVSIMRMEHDQHGEALAGLASLAHDFVPPAGACNTWRALYLGLNQFREDLMQHIHLENNLLFEGLAEARGGVGVGRVDPAAMAAPQVVRPVTGGCGCGGRGSGGGGCA